MTSWSGDFYHHHIYIFPLPLETKSLFLWPVLLTAHGRHTRGTVPRKAADLIVLFLFFVADLTFPQGDTNLNENALGECMPKLIGKHFLTGGKRSSCQLDVCGVFVIVMSGRS